MPSHMFNHVEYILGIWGRKGREGERGRRQRRREGRREKREEKGMVMGGVNDREKGRKTDQTFSA